ncbi:MAG: CRISPR-associated helicase Cas3' [Chloroflexi bacterium]|nr:CRISPR-associated helicase Cas3' [Chloroflexota bacterium]
MTMLSTNVNDQIRREYWAKYCQATGEIHRLEHHLADVGAVMETLLEIPSIKQAAATAGYLAELDPVIAARMCVFAALHDIGKTNLRFQAKANPSRGDGPTASHTKDIMQLLNGQDIDNQERLMEAVPWLTDAMAHWDRNEGGTVCGLIIAMLSHHGQPEQLHNGHQPRSSHWVDQLADFRQQPFDKIHEIASQVKQWFPKAFSQSGNRLPANPEFQHYFLGLLMLADWVGSDIRWFPFQTEPDPGYIETARRRARKAVADIGMDTRGQPVPDFPATLAMISGKPHAQPNATQSAIIEVDPRAQLVVLESETGSGKTEAALLHFQRLKREGWVDGLYFALPTRAAATQIHLRVVNAIRQIMPDAGIEPVLAVPGYIRAGEHEGTTLERYRVHWEDGADDGNRWSAEGSKRFLTAQVAVGTIDQAMLSVLQTKHAHMRAASLARNLLVIDEVHASDTYMRGITQALVQRHRLLGGHTLMMSATLGAVARSTYLGHNIPDFETSKATPYPCITTGAGTLHVEHGGRQKHVNVQTMPVGEKPRDVAKAAHAAQQAGARVLVIRNTVRLAIETVAALEEQATTPSDAVLTVNGKPVPHHSRFAPEDRKLMDLAAEEALAAGKARRGIIVVGTQTLEQSLDIDADYLITDLCPMDVLLQRIGRLHRRQGMHRPEGFQEAMCMVLLPEEEIVEIISKGSTTGLGPRGRVYQDLRVIEATKRQITSGQVWAIPLMNRELVEKSTHPERLNSIVRESPQTWTVHHNQMEGSAYADAITADNILVDWQAPFYDPATGSNDEVIFKANNVMTRLAEPSIDIDFPPGTIGPFGNEISKISIPYWMIGEGAADVQDAVAELIDSGPESFSFQVPTGQRFHYARQGLQRY